MTKKRKRRRSGLTANDRKLIDESGFHTTKFVDDGHFIMIDNDTGEKTKLEDPNAKFKPGDFPPPEGLSDSAKRIGENLDRKQKSNTEDMQVLYQRKDGQAFVVKARTDALVIVEFEPDMSLVVIEESDIVNKAHDYFDESDWQEPEELDEVFVSELFDVIKAELGV